MNALKITRAKTLSGILAWLARYNSTGTMASVDWNNVEWVDVSRYTGKIKRYGVGQQVVIASFEFRKAA